MMHARRAVVLIALASVLALDVSSSPGGADHRGTGWHDSEPAAFADAHASRRHVVVVFGADWCLPCRKVEQIMSDDRVFGLLSERFVPLHFDITELSEHDEAMQAKYHAPTLPAVIFVDAAGRELGRWGLTNASVESFIAEVRSIVALHPPERAADPDGGEP